MTDLGTGSWALDETTGDYRWTWDATEGEWVMDETTGDPRYEAEGGEPDPRITSLDPASLSTSDGLDVTVTVNGANFTDASVVEVDQAAIATTFVSATALTFEFDATGNAGTYEVTVRDGEGESNSVTLEVAEA